jgi:hypothetical protein
MHRNIGYSVIALIWYTILWLKYISYISVNKWLREGSMSNPPPLASPNDDENGKGKLGGGGGGGVYNICFPKIVGERGG